MYSYSPIFGKHYWYFHRERILCFRVKSLRRMCAHLGLSHGFLQIRSSRCWIVRFGLQNVLLLLRLYSERISEISNDVAGLWHSRFRAFLLASCAQRSKFRNIRIPHISHQMDLYSTPATQNTEIEIPRRVRVTMKWDKPQLGWARVESTPEIRPCVSCVFFHRIDAK